jgi:prefoldin subunit 5
MPLLPPNSIDPQSTYNEAILIIEKKFQNLEKRITRMENMNF